MNWPHISARIDDPRRSVVMRNEQRLNGADWKIAKKTTTLLNDSIPAVADFYWL
jgi:hypothetical protein